MPIKEDILNRLDKYFEGVKLNIVAADSRSSSKSYRGNSEFLLCLRQRRQFFMPRSEFPTAAEQRNKFNLVGNLLRGMLTKEQKKKIIDNLTDRIKRQKILVFTDFRGLKVGEMRELRNQFKKAEIEYKVAKKTLIKLALEKAKKEVDTSQFKNSLALAFGYQDPIMPAKIISKFAKEHENLKLLGGIMEDRFLTIEEVKELAKIPSKEELLAKLVWSIKSPVSGFVNVLKGNIRNFVGVLSAIKK